MDRLVVFDLRGTLADSRRPDTLGTHASYPFMPPTTLRGLIAAVLGLEYRADQDSLPPGARSALHCSGQSAPSPNSLACTARNGSEPARTNRFIALRPSS